MYLRLKHLLCIPYIQTKLLKIKTVFKFLQKNIKIYGTRESSRGQLLKEKKTRNILLQ